VSTVADIHTRLCDWLKARGIDCVPSFGVNALHERSTGNCKIVIAPGDEGESLGKLRGSEMLSGATEKRLASLDECFRVYVASYDEKDPTDPKAQYVATKALWVKVYAGLFDSYRAFLPISVKWDFKSMAAPYGAALLMVCTARDFIADTFEDLNAVDVAPRNPAVTEVLAAPGGEE
jgi:hypothetical protein